VHLPRTRINTDIEGNSRLSTPAKCEGKGSNISSRVEAGDITTAVSGTGRGEGVGLSEMSPDRLEWCK